MQCMHAPYRLCEGELHSFVSLRCERRCGDVIIRARSWKDAHEWMFTFFARVQFLPRRFACGEYDGIHQLCLVSMLSIAWDTFQRRRRSQLGIAPMMIAARYELMTCTRWYPFDNNTAFIPRRQPPSPRGSHSRKPYFSSSR